MRRCTSGNLDQTVPRIPRAGSCKRVGGAGGGHIRTAASQATRGHYFQREPPVSRSRSSSSPTANALMLGFSEQWAAPAQRQPFRFGGAARPADLSEKMAVALAKTARRVAVASQLVGLNSADFLVEEDNFRLLEINPRPSATLDIYEPPGGSLFALHISACAGELDSKAPRARRRRDGDRLRRTRCVHSDLGLAGLDRGSSTRWHGHWRRRAAVYCSGFRRHRDGGEATCRDQTCDGSDMDARKACGEQQRQRQRARGGAGRSPCRGCRRTEDRRRARARWAKR